MRLNRVNYMYRVVSLCVADDLAFNLQLDQNYYFSLSLLRANDPFTFNLNRNNNFSPYGANQWKKKTYIQITLH